MNNKVEDFLTRYILVNENLCVSHHCSDIEKMKMKNFHYDNDLLRIMQTCLIENVSNQVHLEITPWLKEYKGGGFEYKGETNKKKVKDCLVYCRNLFSGNHEEGHWLSAIVYKEHKTIVLVDACAKKCSYEPVYTDWMKQILQDVSATLCPGRSAEA